MTVVDVFKHRLNDRICMGILVGALVALAVGFVHAQVNGMAPEVAAAFLDAKIQGLTTRVDALETTLRYAMVGIVGNLITHLFQIQRGRRDRS